MPHKFKAFVAGYGSGKTWVGGMSSCIHYWQHPNINQGYFAPTYPQIRDIFYPTISEVSHSMGLRVEIREANKEVHFYSGRTYRGTTICRSMERPETIVGFKIGHALIDELDVMKTDKAQTAWRKIISRMRYNDAGLKNGIDVTTTPEGFKFTHKMFVSECAEKPDLKNRYGLIQASTYDNEENLPEDYIPSLLEAYPSELINAYLNGEFVNLTSGTVYRNYNRERCNSIETIKDNEPLFIGMDFNVEHMAASVYVKRADGFHAVEELFDVLDTPTMAEMIKNKFADHHISIYPDASGQNRSSKGATLTDLAILRQAGFTIRVKETNPAVKDRINAVNKALEVGKMRVNYRKCPNIARCLEQQAYNERGEPDKASGFDHQNDASGYVIAFEMPIIKPNTAIKVRF